MHLKVVIHKTATDITEGRSPLILFEVSYECQSDYEVTVQATEPGLNIGFVIRVDAKTLP